MSTTLSATSWRRRSSRRARGLASWSGWTYHLAARRRSPILLTRPAFERPDHGGQPSLWHVVRHHRSGDCREAYLPAEQASSSPQARVPAPNVHPRRSSDPQEPAPQGAAPSVGLIDRITSRATFRSFSRSRDRVGTPWFTVIRSSGPPDPPALGAGLAFAIPRRVGTAVQRNRLRRRLRSAARDRYLDRGGPSGWFLVVVRPGAEAASYADLAGALDTALDSFGRIDR